MKSVIPQLYTLYQNHPFISTDTRSLIKNSIFFALNGENFDGNNFALQAIKEGCAYAVVDDSSLKNTDKCFYVENALEALQQLASYHRYQLNIPVIGITGTNGKTTTKELCAEVLSKKYNTSFTKGNLNNHIGVPLSVLEIGNKTEIAVIELGANHIGEIAHLCSIARPNYGLITNIGIAHLEGFGSFEGVVKAKSELYQFIEQQSESMLFVNGDDALLMKNSENINRQIYGMSSHRTSKFENIYSDPFTHLTWLINQHKIIIKTRLVGKYNAVNIMAATCIGQYFKIPIDSIKTAIEEYTPNNQRSQLLQTNSNKVIVDSYNANPDSMSEALANFNEIQDENKVVILGDMLELGDQSKDLHQAIANKIKEYNFRKVILVGQNFGQCKLDKKWIHFKFVENAKAHLTTNTLSGFSILLKASRVMQLEKLIEIL
ncbi:MAG: UDP-N-acetylmuramoyl-tripeptide--D-alanyl-D-alanine ligase [Bacteroidetes bacterium]|nr:UDP-N-acetylmuramoyl-tripeptide--D-alanyl-D-alanine ligase [Bacteroidota bacterium]